MNIESEPPVITVIPSKENYSVGAFMAAYSLSRNTVYGEIRSGKLRIFKHNTRTFIAREDAEAWLKIVREEGNRRILSRAKKKKP